MPYQSTLLSAIVSALETANPRETALATRDIVAAYLANRFIELSCTSPSDRPERPAKRFLQ